MKRSRFAWVLILTLLLSTVLSPSAPAAQAQADVDSVVVRAINAAPDSAGMSIYINETPAARGILPGNGFTFRVPSGKQKLSFRRGSGEILNNAVVELDLKAGQYVSLVAINKVADLKVLVLEDDASPIPPGQARIRVVNTIVGGPAVDVMGPDGSKLFSGVEFGKTSEYKLVSDGKYSLQVASGGNVLASLKDTTLLRKHRYDFFLIGQAGGDVRIASVESGAVLATGTNNLRVGNFIVGGPATDVYVNGELVFAGTRFGSVSYNVAVGAGEYKVEFFPANKTDKATVSTSFTLEANKSAFVAAAGLSTTPEVKVYSEDFAPVRLMRARLMFYHAAKDLPDVNVVLADGTKLAGPISYGTSASIELGAGSTVVKVVTTDGKTLGQREIQSVTSGANGLALYEDDPKSSVGATVTYKYEVTSVIPVRLVHASNTAKNVDVYIDGDKALANWAFGSTTEYIDLAAGTHDVKVYPAGADPKGQGVNPLIDRPDLKVGDAALTGIVFDVGGKPTLSLFPDNLEALGAGRARVRVVNVSSELGVINWSNAIGNQPIGGGAIQPGSASSAVDLPAGSYTFELANPASATIRLEKSQLDAGTLTTFVVTGPGDKGEGVITLKYQVTPGGK